MNTNTSSTRAALLFALVTTTAALFSAPADAQTLRARSNHQNAGGICHATSPWDEFAMERTARGYLNTGKSYDRDDDDDDDDDKRKGGPLTTSNGGGSSSDVVVVCSLVSDDYAVGTPRPPFRVYGLQLFSLDTLTRSQPVSMSCTLSAGYETSPLSLNVTKTILVPTAGQVQRSHLWTAPADNGGTYMAGPVSVTCTVPVGVELHDTIVVFYVDVGA